MDNIARAVLTDKIRSLKATYFQDALDMILLTIYQEDFTQIKQKHDKGSDGILFGNTIIAAYAPESYNLNDFKKKISGDYESYKKHWSHTHSKWMVACNLEITSSMKQFVNKLKMDAQILCIQGLVELIRKQTWTKINLIFKSLDIPDNYFSNDILNTVIEDLINEGDNNDKIVPYEKPIYIADKVDLNLENENIALFLDEYEECLQYFSIIKQIARSYEPKKIIALRAKIRAVYMSLSGGFSEKLLIMTDILTQSKTSDEYYRHHVRVVLIYFFEQCLFGQKTTGEIES